LLKDEGARGRKRRRINKEKKNKRMGSSGGKRRSG
jgi:hypothetical protein